MKKLKLFIAMVVLAQGGAISAFAQTDVTDTYLKDAAVTSEDNWTNGRINSGQQYTGAPDNTYMDTWNDTRDQKQTISNLPAGNYLLKAATRADASLSTGNIYAFSNGSNVGSKNIHMEGASGNLLGNGWAWTRVSFTIAAQADVTIGFYSECGGGKWAGADVFTLTLYDSAEDLAAAELAGAKEDAGLWKTMLTGKTTTAALNAIQAAIDNNEATVAEVENAVKTARALVDAYATYRVYKDAMDAVVAVATTDATKAASRKAEFIDPIASEGENALTVAALNTAQNNIKTAVLNYIKKLTPADATNAPFDLTFLITNPSFDNSYNGWTYNIAPNPGNDNTQRAAHAMEYYEKEFDINQTLTGLVTGNYRLKVKAYQRPGGAANVVTAYVNAEDKMNGTFGTTSEIYVDGGNEAKQAIKNAASPMITTKINQGSESEVKVGETTYYIPNDMVSAVAYFGAGYYENEAEILATTSTIKFGFRSTTPHVGSDWTIFDDFRLYYTGQLDLSTFAQALSDKVAEANQVKTNLNGKVPDSVLNALQDVIDANDNDGDTFEEEEDFTDAISNINKAINAATACQIPYENWKTLKSNCETLAAVANDNPTANNTFTGVISTQNTNVEKATKAEDINNAINETKAASKTYVGATNPTTGNKFNLTFMLTNPDVSGFASWTDVKDVDGWYSDYTDGNRQVMHNQSVACVKGDAFFEYWSENAKSDGKFALYNLVENLPEGTYTINCYAVATANGVAGATTSAVYFYANDTEGSLISADVLTEATISFVNNSQQNVKIGLKPMTGNQFRWMGIGYVELYKVPAQTFTVSENAEYDTTQEGAGAVTLTRTILANTWNTIWLPFSMTESDLKATFGDDVKIAEFSETPNANIAGQSTISFNIMETPAISANKPVLLKTSTASNGNYTIEGRTVVAGTPTTNGTNFSFFGTTVASTTIESGDYFIASDKLWKSVGQTTIKGTRAYLKAQASGARIIGFSIDGNETTAIENIEQGTITTGKVYNLNGQEVKSAQKGILIQNGRKVVVK